MLGVIDLQQWHLIFLVAPIIPYYVACLVFHSLDSMPGLAKYRIQSKVCQSLRDKSSISC